MSTANFRVDTSLTALLGENYRSTETALKELIDNAWDADSSNLKVTMPEPFEKSEIIIEDNGAGMTNREIRNEYLFIARSRTSRKGEFTPLRNRKVKGKKGIGKFAGLHVAGEMILKSKARGKETTLTIKRDELLKWKDDLEKLDLPITSKKCPEDESGTTIILKNLNQNLHFPNPARLSQLLIIEYSRENDFGIEINGKPLDILDLEGNSETGEIKTKNAGIVKFTFIISEDKKSLKQSGLWLRVGGKIIGRPTYFGLEDDEEIPKKLLKKIYGEVEVDGLQDDVTADWGAIFEDSKKLTEVKKAVLPKLKKALKETYSRQISASKARVEKRINIELQNLPKYKRDFATKSLNKVLKKYINEPEEKVNTVISVVLDTLENDEYAEVQNDIEEASNKKVGDFANALSMFGLAEHSIVGDQANNRIKFLESFEQLIQNKKTFAKDVHKSLESNLWMLHERFALMASNESLNSICQNYLNKPVKGLKKSRGVDLVLCKDYKNNILLIELKDPSEEIGSEQQDKAENYRDTLNTMFPHSSISVLVLGKSVDTKIDTKYGGDTIILDSYDNLVNQAKDRMHWVVKELQSHYEY